MHGEPLEDVDCFKYLGSQVATDGGCGTENEWGYWVWGALKYVLGMEKCVAVVSKGRRVKDRPRFGWMRPSVTEGRRWERRDGPWP